MMKTGAMTSILTLLLLGAALTPLKAADASGKAIYKEGLLMARSGNFARAISTWQALVETSQFHLSPRARGKVYICMAKAYFKMTDYEACRGCLDRADLLLPGSNRSSRLRSKLDQLTAEIENEEIQQQALELTDMITAGYEKQLAKMAYEECRREEEAPGFEDISRAQEATNAEEEEKPVHRRFRRGSGRYRSRRGSIRSGMIPRKRRAVNQKELLFNNCDTSRDGFITITEFASVIGEKKAATAMEKFDKNGDELVSRDEFCAN